MKSPANQKLKPAKERTIHTREAGVFETTLQKTNIWLREISDFLHWNDHQKAYRGLRAVLQTLRDRLPVPEAAHLGAQLPMLIRGMYYEDWRPAATPEKVRTSQEFYDAVKEHFKADQNVNPMRLYSGDGGPGGERVAGRAHEIAWDHAAASARNLAGG